MLIKTQNVYGRRHQCSSPLTAKLFNLNFHPLEIVSRWRDPQLQVSENYSDLTKWRSTVFKSCWLMSHSIFNIFKMKSRIYAAPAGKMLIWVEDRTISLCVHNDPIKHRVPALWRKATPKLSPHNVCAPDLKLIIIKCRCRSRIKRQNENMNIFHSFETGNCVSNASFKWLK